MSSNRDAFLAAKEQPSRTSRPSASYCRLSGSRLRHPLRDRRGYTINEALRRLRRNVQGGDVDAQSIPEWEICSQLGIDVITGVGEDKLVVELVPAGVGQHRAAERRRPRRRRVGHGCGPRLWWRPSEASGRSS